MLEGGKGSNGLDMMTILGRHKNFIFYCVAKVGMKCSELLRALALLPGECQVGTGLGLGL